jgi:hypothetical protein
VDVNKSMQSSLHFRAKGALLNIKYILHTAVSPTSSFQQYFFFLTGSLKKILFFQAYARAPVLTVNGGTGGFDGFR